MIAVKKSSRHAIATGPKGERTPVSGRGQREQTGRVVSSPEAGRAQAASDRAGTTGSLAGDRKTGKTSSYEPLVFQELAPKRRRARPLAPMGLLCLVKDLPPKG